MKRPKPLVLIILDGWGVAADSAANAINAASTPNFGEWLKIYPYTTLKSSGKAVGLPEGQMGNSEVGHPNIGAGRIVPQEFTRITDAIDDGSFFDNPVFLQAIDNAKKMKSDFHFMGLLSDGGVHSHIKHIFALLELCKRHDINPFLHMFLDGRDTPPKSALKYIEQLQDKIDELNCGRVATVMGRYYAMDRDRRWDRVQKAYEAIVFGKGYEAERGVDAIRKAYVRGETDEFVQPTVIEKREAPPKKSGQARVGSREKKTDERRTTNDERIQEKDSLVFINFRPDRARELTRTFIDPDFTEFDRRAHPLHVFFVSITQYDETFDIPVAFPAVRPKHILADVLAENNLSQLRIAETEKYAHVTFFFSGGEEIKRPMEERILIPSPKVATYDLVPEMSANEVTAEVIKQIRTDKFDVIILNFANPDMVGHTGVFKAAVKAIETIDLNLGKIVESVNEKDGIVLITADHGNAEKMVESGTDKPYTAHTTDDVPFILVLSQDNIAVGYPARARLDGRLRADRKPSPPRHSSTIQLRKNGILADIAPTILDILGIEKPKEMSGQSLIAK